jgi:DNA invertase Pin-like site-specific DNA recombinase
VKVTAYLRVSTDRQAEEGLGLDVQERAIRAWAKAAGHKVISWHRDEGLSGSNGLDTRVGLYDALAAVQEHRAGGVVVYRLDRLARDLILQEQLLAEVKRMGGEPFSTSAAEAGYLVDDDADPTRKLIRQILGAVNEYERSMIALRLRTGRALKHSRGGYAYGSPPLGFRAEARELVPDAAESATVARIRQLRAEGASTRAIVLVLVQEGRRPKRGGCWHPETVRRVLAREA